MTQAHDAKILAHAVERAKNHPGYLGWIFARYMAIEKISEHGLLRLLGSSVLDLSRLGLCLRPRQDHFANDIEQIAAKFNLESAALANVVRLVESVHAMETLTSQTVSADSGVLMAARARKQKRRPKNKEDHRDKRSKS